MTRFQMTEAIFSVYPGEKTKNKLKKMSDQQVYAFYIRLKKAGKFK